MSRLRKKHVSSNIHGTREPEGSDGFHPEGFMDKPATRECTCDVYRSKKPLIPAQTALPGAELYICPMSEDPPEPTMATGRVTESGWGETVPAY